MCSPVTVKSCEYTVKELIDGVYWIQEKFEIEIKSGELGSITPGSSISYFKTNA